MLSKFTRFATVALSGLALAGGLAVATGSAAAASASPAGCVPSMTAPHKVLAGVVSDVRTAGCTGWSFTFVLQRSQSSSWQTLDEAMWTGDGSATLSHKCAAGTFSYRVAYNGRSPAGMIVTGVTKDVAITC